MRLFWQPNFCHYCSNGCAEINLSAYHCLGSLAPRHTLNDQPITAIKIYKQLELNTGITHLARVSSKTDRCTVNKPIQLRNSKIKYKTIFLLEVVSVVIA